MPSDPAEKFMGYPAASPLGQYLQQSYGGEPCGLELYIDKDPAPTVLKFSVRKMTAKLYRGVLLVSEDGGKTAKVVGKEGSREDVQRWMTSEGVPVLRITPPRPRG
jgi:hypothetical protein